MVRIKKAAVFPPEFSSWAANSTQRLFRVMPATTSTHWPRRFRGVGSVLYSTSMVRLRTGLVSMIAQKSWHNFRRKLKNVFYPEKVLFSFTFLNAKTDVVELERKVIQCFAFSRNGRRRSEKIWLRAKTFDTFFLSTSFENFSRQTLKLIWGRNSIWRLFTLKAKALFHFLFFTASFCSF